MKIFGVLLAAIGLIVLIYGGFSYDRKRTVIDLGPIQATATERHEVPVSPILGGLMLAGGLLLVVVPRKRLPA